MNAEINFVRQQGFADASANACALRYPALMWQPRIIAALVIAGVVFGSSLYFFALGIGLALMVGAPGAPWLLEGLLLAAIDALHFGRFCLGSYVYLLTRGEASLANRTLPWSRVDS